MILAKRMLQTMHIVGSSGIEVMRRLNGISRDIEGDVVHITQV